MMGMLRGNGSDSHQKGRKKGSNWCSEGLGPYVWNGTKLRGPQTALIYSSIVLVEIQINILVHEMKLGGKYQVVASLRNQEIVHVFKRSYILRDGKKYQDDVRRK